MTKEQAEAYCSLVNGHPTSCAVCGSQHPNGLAEIPVRQADGDWIPLAVCSEWCLEAWRNQYGWQE